MITDISMLKAALWYANRGWHVLPLRPAAKESYAGVGVYQATTDLEQLRIWWTQWPNANIGLHCGPSGIIALDLDTYAAEYAGDDLLSIEESSTTTNLTGNGGEHLLFQMPNGERFGSSGGALPSGIHAKGFGGYIVLPPSVHPCGKRYEWEEGFGPHEVPPQPLPHKLYSVLKAAQTNKIPAVHFGPTQAQKPDLDRWQLSARILELIRNPRPRDERSEADQCVITALVCAGVSDNDIRAVFDHYPIGRQGKYADRVGHGEQYLAHSIARARLYVQVDGKMRV